MVEEVPGGRLKACGRCMLTRYCSPECQVGWGKGKVAFAFPCMPCTLLLQRKDWRSGHKTHCPEIAEEWRQRQAVDAQRR